MKDRLAYIVFIAIAIVALVIFAFIPLMVKSFVLGAISVVGYYLVYAKHQEIVTMRNIIISEMKRNRSFTKKVYVAMKNTNAFSHTSFYEFNQIPEPKDGYTKFGGKSPSMHDIRNIDDIIG